MIINMRYTGRFLFLTALLLETVFSEGNDYVRSYSIDDESVMVYTTTGEANVSFAHPVRYVVTPKLELLDEFNLNWWNGWSGIMPLKIQFGKGTNNKHSDIALHSAIKRMGEVIESCADRTIPDVLSAPGQKVDRPVYTTAAVNYIFQDTFQPVNKRINRALIKPGSRVSLHDNDIKHSFGNIWAMFQPSPDKTREVGFFVVYLDQGIYLLIHEHGFKFLDLAGFRKLVEVTLESKYTWQSATLAPTWSQWLYSLSGYLPSTNNVIKLISEPALYVTFAAVGIGAYGARKFYSSLSGSNRAVAAHEQPEVKKTKANPKAKKPKAKKPKANKSVYSKPDVRGASCEEYCRSDGFQCQSDQKQEEERLWQQKAERFRQQERILKLRSDITTQAINAELDIAEERALPNREQQLRRSLVTTLLIERLDSGWTIEELVAAIFENPDEDQLRKLRWIFRKSERVSPKLKLFKQELEKTRW